MTDASARTRDEEDFSREAGHGARLLPGAHETKPKGPCIDERREPRFLGRRRTSETRPGVTLRGSHGDPCRSAVQWPRPAQRRGLRFREAERREAVGLPIFDVVVLAARALTAARFGATALLETAIPLTSLTESAVAVAGRSPGSAAAVVPRATSRRWPAEIATRAAFARGWSTEVSWTARPSGPSAGPRAAGTAGRPSGRSAGASRRARPILRLVHADRATVEGRTIHLLNRVRRARGIRERHEPETA